MSYSYGYLLSRCQRKKHGNTATRAYQKRADVVQIIVAQNMFIRGQGYIVLWGQTRGNKVRGTDLRGTEGSQRPKGAVLIVLEVWEELDPRGHAGI